MQQLLKHFKIWQITHRKAFHSPGASLFPALPVTFDWQLQKEML